MLIFHFRIIEGISPPELKYLIESLLSSKTSIGLTSKKFFNITNVLSLPNITSGKCEDFSQKNLRFFVKYLFCVQLMNI